LLSPVGTSSRAKLTKVCWSAASRRLALVTLRALEKTPDFHSRCIKIIMSSLLSAMVLDQGIQRVL
jgi:hypothetical protein